MKTYIFKTKIRDARTICKINAENKEEALKIFLSEIINITVENENK